MQIYADHAATTKMSRAAVQAMMPYIESFYGNPSCIHTEGVRAAQALMDSRRTMAACLGADFREIYFTSGGSEADNQALVSAAALGAGKGHKHIISTAFEHPAVLHSLEKLKRQGFEVTLLDVHENGRVLPQQVEEALREDTCLVSVMYANNEIGSIQPVAEIGAVCRKHGVLFHTDAVQAVGHVPIDVRAQNIDLLSLSGHKFYGPKGTGALFARQGIVLSSLIEGGSQEQGKRAGTENIAGIAAMAAALEESCAHMDDEYRRLSGLRNGLIEGLKKVPGAVLNGDPVHRLPGNVHFCFEGIDGTALVLLLDKKGILASSGSACVEGALHPSHVLQAVGRERQLALGALRLTLGVENTQADVDFMLKEIPEAVAFLRKEAGKR